MPTLIDCWNQLKAKGYKHADGSEVLDENDYKSLMKHIQAQSVLNPKIDPLDAAKEAVTFHRDEAHGQLESIYSQLAKPEGGASEEVQKGEKGRKRGRLLKTPEAATVQSPAVDFVPDDVAEPIAGLKAPKLLSGEKQGDLLSSTQSEAFALVGEKAAPGTHPVELAEMSAKEQAAEAARLKAEHEQGLLSDFQQHQARGGDELLDVVAQHGLPAKSSRHFSEWSGELSNLMESYRGTRGPKSGIGAKAASTGEAIKYADLFKKGARSVGSLAETLRSKGFDIEHDSDVFPLIEQRLASGKPMYGSEARGQILEAASFSGAPEFGLPFAFGPGAAARGESLSPMGALKQQVQTMRGTVKPGTPKSAGVTESVVRSWARGKSNTQSALGSMVAGGQRMKEIFRGINNPSELRDRVGQYQFEIQQSRGRSKQAKQAMKNEIPDQTLREAANIWIDSGQDEQLIRDSIPEFPAKTAVNVRRAAEMAANMPPAGKFFARALQDFFKTRGQEAQSEGVMDELLKDYTTHVWQKEKNMPGRLISAMQSGQINTYFDYAKQRKIPTFIEGILQGKTPVLDPAETIPFYNLKLDEAIASRRFIADLSELTEADGRPTVSPSRVRVAEVGTPPEATLISPRSKGMAKRAAGSPEPFIEMTKREAETFDYDTPRPINHPALKKWVWTGTDQRGNPIFYKGDLQVHPDAYKRLSRMMDRGILTPSTPTRVALGISTQVKGAKLGLWSLFHPVHVGSHALFHWTNAFKQLGRGDIDVESPLFQHAVEKGHVTLVPSDAELHMMSGDILSQNGLWIHKIPKLGPWSKGLAEWTFGKFIPKLKLATFDNAYRRAIWTRDNLGLYKGLTEDQIAERIGDSVNNAFGELNYQFLGKHGRSPEFQRALRLMFLAPDFGEARARFAGKAFTRYGHEERLALATMFVTLYGGARVANMLSTGDPQWDWKHAFELKTGDRWWSMRSVLGDMNRMFADSGQFFYNRLNPAFSRTLVDWLTSRDIYTGRRLSPSEKYFSRPLEQLVPLQLGGITRDDQHVWESFVTSLGVQTHRDNPVGDVHKLVSNWKEYSNDPKLRAQWERSQQETFGQSDYAKMRYALDDDNPEAAYREYYRLRTEVGKKAADFKKAFDPNRALSGSHASERQFVSQLDEDGRATYDRGVRHQKLLYEKYRAMLKEYAGIEQ